MEDGSVVGFTEHVHVGVKGRSNEVQQVILVLDGLFRAGNRTLDATFTQHLEVSAHTTPFHTLSTECNLTFRAQRIGRYIATTVVTCRV